MTIAKERLLHTLGRDASLCLTSITCIDMAKCLHYWCYAGCSPQLYQTIITCNGLITICLQINSLLAMIVEQNYMQLIEVLGRLVDTWSHKDGSMLMDGKSCCSRRYVLLLLCYKICWYSKYNITSKFFVLEPALLQPCIQIWS